MWGEGGGAGEMDQLLKADYFYRGKDLNLSPGTRHQVAHQLRGEPNASDFHDICAHTDIYIKSKNKNKICFKRKKEK